ncbi:MAG: DNA primase [Candidatus Omnitrophota bacterium]
MEIDMGRISQEIIDQILDRIDIAEVVSGYIHLKKAGRNFKANCPFHNEKTPSFVVSPDKQIYHCFGCSAGGNAISFVMKYENIEFPEAVRMMAARAGVELPESRPETDRKDSIVTGLYELNKTAATFYQNLLQGADGRRALEYLKGRGIDLNTLSLFRIGYAPDAWESFRKYCESEKIAASLARTAGLTIPSDKGKNDYDRFRKRIMFPIFNERGNIVGFGGRVMDDPGPKYINSPESPVYHKSNVLYGLNFSKKGIREKGYAVIVEGYMDVIIPFQHGIMNIVATSGTALTSTQVAMLKRHTSDAVMVFDADQAGESASLRGLDILIENGMNVRIAGLPQGEDPDSFVRKNGKEGFEDILNSAKGLFEYKLDLLIRKMGARNIGGIVDEMLPTIAKVDNAVIQSDYLRKLAESLGIHEASLRYEMGKVKPDYSFRYGSEAKVEKNCRNYRSSESHLLGLALLDKRIFYRIMEELGMDMFRDEDVRRALKAAGDIFGQGESSVNPGKLLSRFEDDADVKAAVIEAVAKADITSARDKALNDCMSCVRRENREEALKALTLELKKAEQSGNSQEIMELVAKMNKLHKEKVI